jgi:hypothetical protein
MEQCVTTLGSVCYDTWSSVLRHMEQCVTTYGAVCYDTWSSVLRHMEQCVTMLGAVCYDTWSSVFRRLEQCATTLAACRGAAECIVQCLELWACVRACVPTCAWNGKQKAQSIDMHACVNWVQSPKPCMLALARHRASLMGSCSQLGGVKNFF